MLQILEQTTNAVCVSMYCLKIGCYRFCGKLKQFNNGCSHTFQRKANFPLRSKFNERNNLSFTQPGEPTQIGRRENVLAPSRKTYFGDIHKYSIFWLLKWEPLREKKILWRAPIFQFRVVELKWGISSPYFLIVVGTPDSALSKISPYLKDIM